MPEPLEDHHSSGLPPTVDGTVVTVGTFDGVHRGHRDVLSRLADRAVALGKPSVVVSFEPHPLEIVNPDAAPLLLTTYPEKLEVMAESGVNYLVVIPFTLELSRFSAEQFVDAVLLRRARMAELMIGYDHGFGRGRAGDAEILRMIGSRRGFGVTVVPPVMGSDERPVSSTSIRRAIAGGDLARAADALGRPYSISGQVVRGEGRGRGIGYPTINVALPAARKLLPPQGVYAVRVQTPGGSLGGMMNLGPRPTFGKSELTIEAHLFDVSGDFYGQHVRVDLIAHLRDTAKFNGIDELRAQLGRDEATARTALTHWLQLHNMNSFTAHSDMSGTPE
jgi:riboflavin kinase/FMN adenylyltransferase